MERTEVDIADSLKNLKAKDRIKMSHVFFLLFFFLIIGFTAEFMYIKTLKRELDSLKIEVEKMRGAADNSTDSAIANTNSQVRDLKEKTLSVEERLKFLENEMNTTQNKVDNANHNTSVLKTEMDHLNDKVNWKIENVETKYDLLNVSYLLSTIWEMMEIPQAVKALKNETKIANLNINTIGDTISSLIKNTSDVNAELKRTIENDTFRNLAMLDSVVALNESILITKAEIKDMKNEASLRWNNVTETIESLEHRVNHTKKIIHYLTMGLVNWKTTEYLQLYYFTQALELLEAEKPQHNTSNESTSITSYPIQKSAESSDTSTSKSKLKLVTESELMSRNDEPNVSKTDDGNAIRNEVNANANIHNSNEIPQEMSEKSNSPTSTLENFTTSVKPSSNETI